MAARVLDLLRGDAEQTYAHYTEMLDENGPGLARELARMNLTLNTYTQWYWKTDLHNLFNFLKLRADPHAQYEIRVYAEAMLETVKAWVPLSHAAFRDYRLGAVTFSAGMMHVLKKLLAGEPVDQSSGGLSKREWSEMLTALGREVS